MPWEAVIGLEIHAQLATRSKIFSSSATAFGAPPNTQADAIDLGLPGVLPVLNREAVRLAALFGLAIGARVASRSVFARKNYFYPDLPKGYQISQYELPIVAGGAVNIALPQGGEKRINITRAHLEEDAGKSLHEDFHGFTGIDLNRAGTPLLEIVSEPELSSAAEAAAYMRKIHTLVRYLGISDGNMQEGSFRADANVSLRPAGQTEFGTRTEIKNLNSFRFLESAVEFEIERQAALLESGGTVVQETRLYDPERGQTRSMRGKEEANDYRYFPDPDLLPVSLEPTLIDTLAAELPELPDARRERFQRDYGLPPEPAAQLADSREFGDYFEAVIGAAEDAGVRLDPRLAANWVSGELTARLNRTQLTLADSPVGAVQLGGLLRRVADGTISGNLAKQVFDALWDEPGGAADAVDRIIEQRGLRQVSDHAAIEAALVSILAANPDQLAQYRAGKTKLKGFFVGQAMKAFQGKANPQQVNRVLERLLEKGD